MKFHRAQMMWARLNRKVRKEFLVLLGLFGLTGIICWTAWIFDRTPTNQSETVIEGIDTYIPKGMVLVPIEVQNLESLDSVFGQKGAADLYWVGRDGRAAVAAAHGVALYRAPLNPRQFAALVPEAQAPRLVKAGGAFHVVLLNPKSSASGRALAQSEVKHRTRVVVLGQFENTGNADTEEPDAIP